MSETLEPFDEVAVDDFSNTRFNQIKDTVNKANMINNLVNE